MYPTEPLSTTGCGLVSHWYRTWASFAGVPWGLVPGMASAASTQSGQDTQGLSPLHTRAECAEHLAWGGAPLPTLLGQACQAPAFPVPRVRV